MRRQILHDSAPTSKNQDCAPRVSCRRRRGATGEPRTIGRKEGDGSHNMAHISHLSRVWVTDNDRSLAAVAQEAVGAPVERSMIPLLQGRADEVEEDGGGRRDERESVCHNPRHTFTTPPDCIFPYHSHSKHNSRELRYTLIVRSRTESHTQRAVGLTRLSACQVPLPPTPNTRKVNRMSNHH